MSKKIDLFYKSKYLCSTNSAKTCREAKARVLSSYQDQITHANSGYTDAHYAKLREIVANPDLLKAFFDKTK